MPKIGLELVEYALFDSKCQQKGAKWCSRQTIVYVTRKACFLLVSVQYCSDSGRQKTVGFVLENQEWKDMLGRLNRLPRSLGLHLSGVDGFELI